MVRSCRPKSNRALCAARRIHHSLLLVSLLCHCGVVARSYGPCRPRISIAAAAANGLWQSIGLCDLQARRTWRRRGIGGKLWPPAAPAAGGSGLRPPATCRLRYFLLPGAWRPPCGANSPATSCQLLLRLQPASAPLRTIVDALALSTRLMPLFRGCSTAKQRCRLYCRSCRPSGRRCGAQARAQASAALSVAVAVTAPRRAAGTAAGALAKTAAGTGAETAAGMTEVLQTVAAGKPLHVAAAGAAAGARQKQPSLQTSRSGAASASDLDLAAAAAAKMTEAETAAAVMAAAAVMQAAATAGAALAATGAAAAEAGTMSPGSGERPAVAEAKRIETHWGAG